jgi:hypothetical protein
MVPVLARAIEWEHNGTHSSKSNGKESKMVPVLARAMERRAKWYPF